MSYGVPLACAILGAILTTVIAFILYSERENMKDKEAKA